MPGLIVFFVFAAISWALGVMQKGAHAGNRLILAQFVPLLVTMSMGLRAHLLGTQVRIHGPWML